MEYLQLFDLKGDKKSKNLALSLYAGWYSLKRWKARETSHGVSRFLLQLISGVGRWDMAKKTAVADRKAKVADVELTKEEMGLLSPAKCRVYLRRRLAKEFEGITDGFLDAAKMGSCQHLKLATELLGPTRKSKDKPRQTVGAVYEKIRREVEEKRRLAAAGETVEKG